MNTAELAMALLAPQGFGGSPYDMGTGMPLFAGMNYGLQAGGGITGFAGVLSAA